MNAHRDSLRNPLAIVREQSFTSSRGLRHRLARDTDLFVLLQSLAVNPIFVEEKKELNYVRTGL